MINLLLIIVTKFGTIYTFKLDFKESTQKPSQKSEKRI